MRRSVVIATAVVWLAGSTPGEADTPRYVGSRQVILGFHAAEPGLVDSVDYWVSLDGGQSWEAVPALGPGPTPLRYIAAGDGRYDFYIVLHNSAGASAPAPQSGTSPHTSLVVDTAAPVLQVHAAYVRCVSETERVLRAQLALVDENLTEREVRVFYRANEAGAWEDGGAAAVEDGQVAWRVPPGVGPKLDVRLLATDLAGNRASDEVANVPIIAVRATSQPASQPAAPAAAADSPLARPPAVAVQSLPEPRPAITPRTDAAADEPVAGLPPEHEPTAPPPPGNSAERQHLCRLAARYMAEGRYALAAARLEDALRGAPRDVDLQVALGSALYRAGRHSEAGQLFDSALAAAPDHAGAIEGAALVSATQSRYPEAREQLLRLLELKPDSAKTWLRYGDIEHKLGNRQDALRAWQRAVETHRADRDVRENARARLRYFGSARGTRP
ncbi:MAG: tetratricopeptide repeat protein [Planctomycetes bacterium]|nr:tetratricopeptide repeat protein [Planctomycetota bacterium]